MCWFDEMMLNGWILMILGTLKQLTSEVCGSNYCQRLGACICHDRVPISATIMSPQERFQWAHFVGFPPDGLESIHSNGKRNVYVLLLNPKNQKIEVWVVLKILQGQTCSTSKMQYSLITTAKNQHLNLNTYKKSYTYAFSQKLFTTWIFYALASLGGLMSKKILIYHFSGEPKIFFLRLLVG